MSRLTEITSDNVRIADNALKVFPCFEVKKKEKKKTASQEDVPCELSIAQHYTLASLRLEVGITQVSRTMSRLMEITGDDVRITDNALKFLSRLRSEKRKKRIGQLDGTIFRAS